MEAGPIYTFHCYKLKELTVFHMKCENMFTYYEVGEMQKYPLLQQNIHLHSHTQQEYEVWT